MPHHNHFIQLDDLAYESLQGLQALFGTVVLQTGMQDLSDLNLSDCLDAGIS